jgi:hypothetical protein
VWGVFDDHRITEVSMSALYAKEITICARRASKQQKEFKTLSKGQTGNPLGNSTISEAYKQLLPLPAPDKVLVGKCAHLRGHSMKSVQ